MNHQEAHCEHLKCPKLRDTTNSTSELRVRSVKNTREYTLCVCFREGDDCTEFGT